MINDPTFRHRGLYVEGRHFGADFDCARSFAFALAVEYIRPIKVWFNAPNEAFPTTELFTAQPDKIPLQSAA
jgi:hypothetical protein